MTGIKKHTIAGPIPEEWNARLIKNCCDVVRGASPRPAGDPRYFDGDYLPWITVADVTSKLGMYLRGTRAKLTQEGANFTRLIPPETLIITNSGATLGVPKITQELSGANDGIAAFLNLKEITKECLYYILESKTDYFRNELAPGVGQPNLNTDLLGDVAIPIPSAGEQKRIVDALSTWDAAIQKVEQLIAAKGGKARAIAYQIYKKKPDWILCRLGDFLREVKNIHGTGNYIVGSVGKNGIRPRSEVYSKQLSDNHERNILVEPEWLCFGLASDAIAFGVNFTNVTYSVSPAYKTYEIQNADPGFIDSYLRVFNERLSQRYLITSARQGKAIDFDGLLGDHCYFPHFSVQRRISEALKSMQSEIFILGKYLQALQTQKRGLMQKLLTGQWRLNDVKAEAA